MSIDAVGSLYLKPMTAQESIQKPDPGFLDALTRVWNNTNDHLLAADTALQQLAEGKSPSLHQTMLTLEEAKLSFQLLEQVRNRLMSSYQDLLKESI